MRVLTLYTRMPLMSGLARRPNSNHVRDIGRGRAALKGCATEGINAKTNPKRGASALPRAVAMELRASALPRSNTRARGELRRRVPRVGGNCPRVELDERESLHQHPPVHHRQSHIRSGGGIRQRRPGVAIGGEMRPIALDDDEIRALAGLDRADLLFEPERA